MSLTRRDFVKLGLASPIFRFRFPGTGEATSHRAQATPLKTGRDVREKRLALGIRQEELAHLAGVHWRDIDFLEVQDDVPLPQEHAQALTEALNKIESRQVQPPYEGHHASFRELHTRSQKLHEALSGSQRKRRS